MSTLAAAQQYEGVAPIRPPSRPASALPSLPLPPPDQSERIAIAVLHGLEFVATDSTAGESATMKIAHGSIFSIGAPALDEGFLRRFDADLGKPVTFGRLADIRAAVVKRFRAAGEPLVDVYLPEQDVTAGIVRIAVVKFRVGNVVAQGNRHFSDALLTGEMPLRHGALIRDTDVALGLALLNANPYRRVDVVYTPGTAPNTTDIVLQTEDRLPLRVSAGYDNAGVPQLGRDRFFAGVDYGNLFGLDHDIAWQTTVSNDFFRGNPPIEGRPNRPRFVAHAFSYAAPLPWFDRVELFGLFAQSTPRLPDSYSQSGISAQLSFRYDWLLPAVAGWQQQVQFGYDFKRSNNDLEFGGMQVFGSNTHTHQVVLAWHATRTDSYGQADANVTLVTSPGHLDADNEPAAYNAVRMGASPRYAYAKISGQRVVTIGRGFSLSARGLFQWTGNTLLPAEEIGLGGDSSVRGYEPYAVQGDRGWNVQTELRAPSLVLGNSGIVLQAFMFVDAGHVWNRSDQPTENGNAALASIGAGVRFELERFISIRATFGQPLKAATPHTSKAPLAQIFVVVGN
ncbi:ShlB/FhaC/HecB family hemolysin secretion/activation protein [Burkholderia ubonensis]|nr:ShlB/FhaC/HecB family hemolysin secretion/activation protein [Burkholderia ubonensis]